MSSFPAEIQMQQKKKPEDCIPQLILTDNVEDAKSSLSKLELTLLLLILQILRKKRDIP